jgi:hypothetical protein
LSKSLITHTDFHKHPSIILLHYTSYYIQNVYCSTFKSHFITNKMQAFHTLFLLVIVVMFGFIALITHAVEVNVFQQEAMLLGSIMNGQSRQGYSVSLDAHGDTLASGSGFGVGATWVFKRCGANWTQESWGGLVGTGAIGDARQGISVSLSGDGNTLASGGAADNSNTGAVWIFMRNSGTAIIWTQQGSKLVGTGATGHAYQGNSVSLSGDGNTLASGGIFDNSNVGAVWVFTRSMGMWEQQGSKLVGSGAVIGAVGYCYQGTSVSLNFDGSTLASGGAEDNSHIGAVWVYMRSASGMWTQQSTKLVGNGITGTISNQGTSVSLSSDGNTLASGGQVDGGGYVGAVWVFTRNDGIWTQQGSKLVGTGAMGETYQGTSVSLTADGNMLVSGGRRDNSYVGAVWVFTRSTGGMWAQQGSKLVGTGGVGISLQGYSVSMSSDGSTLADGGFYDNSFTGGVWMWTRRSTSSNNPTSAPSILNSNIDGTCPGLSSSVQELTTKVSQLSSDIENFKNSITTEMNGLIQRLFSLTPSQLPTKKHKRGKR